MLVHDRDDNEPSTGKEQQTIEKSVTFGGGSGAEAAPIIRPG
jgi:hypothetical protein